MEVIQFVVCFKQLLHCAAQKESFGICLAVHASLVQLVDTAISWDRMFAKNVLLDLQLKHQKLRRLVHVRLANLVIM